MEDKRTMALITAIGAYSSTVATVEERRPLHRDGRPGGSCGAGHPRDRKAGDLQRRAAAGDAAATEAIRALASPVAQADTPAGSRVVVPGVTRELSPLPVIDPGEPVTCPC